VQVSPPDVRSRNHGEALELAHARGGHRDEYGQRSHADVHARVRARARAYVRAHAVSCGLPARSTHRSGYVRLNRPGFFCITVILASIY